MERDFAIEYRLGEGGFVGLVVAVAAVADDIDNGVGSELLAIFQGDLGREDDGIRVVSVGVKDGRFGELRDLGAMTASAAFVGVGREPDLIISDDVQRAADLVALELSQVEGFHDDALAGESRVAVQEDGQGFRAIPAALDVNERAGATEYDRIDGFEVAGVVGEGDADFLAIDDAGAGVAEVILYVAVAMRGVRDVVFGEGAEEGFGFLAADIDQDIEAAAMGHTDDEISHPEAGSTVDDLIQCGEHDFATFDGEALRADKSLVQETFELFGLDD